MSKPKEFIAVDWRSGKDRFYFFFKDSNTYTRFDIGDNKVPDDYPTEVKPSNWDSFHSNAKNLRFGFTTTNLLSESQWSIDEDFLWLFYYEGHTPMVCKYDQDDDKVIRNYRVADSEWRKILPYFDRIVAGTWWRTFAPGNSGKFRFLMNDGNSLLLDWNLPQRPPHFNEGIHELKLEPITDATWPGLEPYKHRIMTAVQNDRTLADSHLYIFLTDNEYITYNIQENKVEYGPYEVNDVTWPGLLRD
ncbi:hypothetical protein Q8X48_09290 [Pseudomonas sp. QLc11A]|jgi:hypothetical protein|uniref:Uncharacterized protein n=1 Tax=Pseudomonas azerbaijanorientalis TaxID=2842350 RepID=A0ABW8W997_9PSED